MEELELLVRIATGKGEVCEKARQMIGVDELALLIASAAVKNTSIRLSPKKVADTLGMSEQGARNKIENTLVKVDSRNRVH